MHYQKPSAIGGTLIRKVILGFKAQQFSLPIDGPIFIATSGGVDSMALAHLIATYGRKIISPAQMTLLHFDHQWRKESGTIEKKAVQKLAKELGVGFLGVKLAKPTHANRLNWEEDARRKRNEFYFSQKKAQFILTAHHQDDVAETLFWRFLRGEFDENREGILFQDDKILRPLLQVTKQELYAYAQGEKVSFFEDPTNADPSQMRSFLRKELFPLLQKRFPALKATLARYVRSSRCSREPKEQTEVSPKILVKSSSAVLAVAKTQKSENSTFPGKSNFAGKIVEKSALSSSLATEVVTHAVEQITTRLNRTQKNAINAAIQASVAAPKRTQSKKITLPGGVVLTTESKAGGTRFLIEILDHVIRG
jgi:tRNA(Ile)-lysidine synthetase-like protein